VHNTKHVKNTYTFVYFFESQHASLFVSNDKTVIVCYKHFAVLL